MKGALAAAALAAAFAAGGCFSLETARIHSSGCDHVLASNYGWYLFHCIPVACGNASKDPWFPWAIFRDDVTLDKIQSRFMESTDPVKVRDLSYSTQESVMLQIPGLNFPLPIPYLLTYREIQLSGTTEREVK